MDQATLVGRIQLFEQDIEEGGRLVHALQQQGIEIVAAFWHVPPESTMWQLVVATPLVDTEGPMQFYRHVQRIIGELGLKSVALNDVSVMSPTSSLIASLRSSGIAFGGGGTARLGSTMLGGTVFYVLR